MQIETTTLPGLLICTPVLHGDQRGSFAETYRAAELAQASGRPFRVAQANTSTSRRGVVRGVHFALVPPGQAKYVQCPAGTILDVIVDLRVGSPSFGTHVAVELDDVQRRAVFIPEGYGHAFCALSESATVNYLCSTPYTPDREFGVHPLDEQLALPWPTDTAPQLSARDAAAPTLAQAERAGQLPTLADCAAFADRLRDGSR